MWQLNGVGWGLNSASRADVVGISGILAPYARISQGAPFEFRRKYFFFFSQFLPSIGRFLVGIPWVGHTVITCVGRRPPRVLRSGLVSLLEIWRLRYPALIVWHHFFRTPKSRILDPSLGCSQFEQSNLNFIFRIVNSPPHSLVFKIFDFAIAILRKIKPSLIDVVDIWQW